MNDPNERKHLFAAWCSLVVFIAGLLLPLLIAVVAFALAGPKLSPRHTYVLACFFGMIAEVLALIFGNVGRQHLPGKIGMIGSSVLLLGGVLVIAMLFDDHPQPVTRDKLLGSHVCRSDYGEFKWTFTDERFEITPGPDPIPWEILTAILSDGFNSTRIQGRWQVVNGDLLLSDISTEARGTHRDVCLHPYDTAVIRIDLGGRQFVIE
jgi:hypothetical protein